MACLTAASPCQTFQRVNKDFKLGDEIIVEVDVINEGVPRAAVNNNSPDATGNF
jgi:hypothetical protein